jgi:hypothetical protein
MRHAIEHIAEKNYAEMEATFELMRQASPDNKDFPTPSKYKQGQLFGRYERMLSMHNTLEKALDGASKSIYHQGS